MVNCENPTINGYGDVYDYHNVLTFRASVDGWLGGKSAVIGREGVYGWMRKRVELSENIAALIEFRTTQPEMMERLGIKLYDSIMTYGDNKDFYKHIDISYCGSGHACAGEKILLNCYQNGCRGFCMALNITTA